MKRVSTYLIIALLVAGSFFSVWLPIYIWPKEVSAEYQGVMFREGVPDYEETVSISIDGYMNNRLFGGKKFLGKILITGGDAGAGFMEQTIKIKFNSKGLGIMYYVLDNDTEYNLLSFAYVSMEKDARSLTISLLEGKDESTYSFSGNLMISGPADNRTEGLLEANRLMGKFLSNPLN